MENNDIKKIETLSQQIDKEASIVLLMERADLFIKTAQPAKAINDYYQILKLDSKHEYAKNKIEYLKTILRYNNTDIYASPNTNFDPWLE